MDKYGTMRIVALNVNGLNDGEKEKSVMSYVSDLKPDVIALTDTRFGEDIKSDFTKRYPEYQIYYASIVPKPQTQSKGVLVMISRKSDIKVLKCHPSNDGMSLLLETVAQGIPMLFGAVYGPSDPKKDAKNVDWWKSLKEKIDSLNYLKQAIMGDLNYFTDVDIDTFGYERQNRPKTSRLIQLWEDNNELIDSYRNLYPTGKEWSWSGKRPGGGRQGSRLDHFLASPTMQQLVRDVQYQYVPHTCIDHKSLIVSISPGQFKFGKPNTRCPPGLQKDLDYLQHMRTVWAETIINHLDLPKCTNWQLVHTPEEDLADLPSKADPSVLYELCLSNCKEATAKYVKRRNILRKRQKSDLEYAYEKATKEVQKDPLSEESQAHLAAVEADLQLFNEAAAEEAALYLKDDWVSDTERPTKWYLNLSKNTGAAGTINKLRVPSTSPDKPDMVITRSFLKI